MSLILLEAYESHMSKRRPSMYSERLILHITYKDLKLFDFPSDVHLDLATAGLATADFRYRRSNFWGKNIRKKRDLPYLRKKVSQKCQNVKKAT